MAIAALSLIVVSLPNLLSQPEITLQAVWDNVLIWLVIPLPFLFLTRFALLITKGITALQGKISDATYALS